MNLYPFVETVAVRRRAGRRGRADRHRRPRDGARLREEPRQRRDRRRARPLRATHRRARRRRHDPRAAPTRLAAEAFAHTATYDIAVASLVRRASRLDEDGDGVIDWPALRRRCTWNAPSVLRYGENSHQRAALYVDRPPPAGIAQATQLHGKEMSYNNYVDADAALRAAFDFAEPAVAIIKHANPCGIAVAARLPPTRSPTPTRAHDCDPVSAFGGVIAANRTITARHGRDRRGHLHRGHRRARASRPRPLEVLSKPRRTCACCACPRASAARRTELRQVSGGLLCRCRTGSTPTATAPRNWTLVAGDAADAATLADLEFAWTRLPRRQVERDPARRRTAPRSASAWARSTGRLLQARRRARRRPRRRLGRGIRRVLPVRRRAADPDRRRRPRRRAARRLGPRRRGHRGGEGRRASRCTSRASGTSSTR